MNHTSNGLKVELTTSRPALVRSVMEMTETSEESLIRLMNWPASGGSTRLKACGRMT